MNKVVGSLFLEYEHKLLQLILSYHPDYKMTQVDLTDEQIAALNAMAAAPTQETPTQTPETLPTQETREPEQQSIQPSSEPAIETVPATGTTLATETPEHPALTKIQEIEEHLGLLSMYGSVEQELRKLVAELKAIF